MYEVRVQHLNETPSKPLEARLYGGKEGLHEGGTLIGACVTQTPCQPLVMHLEKSPTLDFTMNTLRHTVTTTLTHTSGVH